jgi:hypothetical protein
MGATCKSNIQDATCGVKHRTLDMAERHSETLNNLHRHPFGNKPKHGYCLGCSGAYLDYKPTELFSFAVETLDRPYVNHVPWADAKRETGLTEREAIGLYAEGVDWYQPEAHSWSGHVRIVGSDGWVYFAPYAGQDERPTLQRLIHRDDIA